MTRVNLNALTSLSDAELTALAGAPDKDKITAVAAELSNFNSADLDAALVQARLEAGDVSLTPQRRMARFALSLFLEVEIDCREAPEMAALEAQLQTA